MSKFTFRAIGYTKMLGGKLENSSTIYEFSNFEDCHAKLQTLWDFDSSVMQIWCNDVMISEIKGH